MPVVIQFIIAKATEALVIKAFDKELYATINEEVYALKEVLARTAASKNFDISNDDEPKQKTKYIPPMSHPWKRGSFKTYLYKQSHRKEKTA